MKFYTVDDAYVKCLYSQDNEVFYDTNYANKPYIGIVVLNNNYHYFIPLTSAKPKHTKWKNITKTNYLIYERHNGIPDFNGVFKIDQSNNTYKQILAVLEIKKMIPVPISVFHEIVFSQIMDADYRHLLLKEYHFLKFYKKDIFQKAENIYKEQITTGVIKPFHCNYKFLESICDSYSHNFQYIVN